MKKTILFLIIALITSMAHAVDEKNVLEITITQKTSYDFLGNKLIPVTSQTRHIKAQVYRVVNGQIEETQDYIEETEYPKENQSFEILSKNKIKYNIEGFVFSKTTAKLTPKKLDYNENLHVKKLVIDRNDIQKALTENHVNAMASLIILDYKAKLNMSTPGVTFEHADINYSDMVCEKEEDLMMCQQTIKITNDIQ
ncbi:MAG: hypothetical protein KAQ98_10150 [Bacteriovoracaceae bacterium]|nr:hypothetical protein [Bacteriovoracaceae bacterium]